jgi:hypothetical protein
MSARKFRTALLGVAVACAPAFANDSAATLAAGGIVLTKSDGIVLEREDLTIGARRVRVAYVFRNVSGEDIRTRVAFALPSTEDELGDIVWADAQRPENPMRFSVVVDGVPQPFETETKDGWAIHHHWMQTFPKDRPVSVVHEYVPVAGSFAVGFPQFPYEDAERELARRYCVGPKLLDWVRTRGGDYALVHYVLRTGANWRGPIGRFTLTLEKDAPDGKVSLCFPGRPVETSPTTFVFERTDFEPRQDLQVFFMRRATVPEDDIGDWVSTASPCASDVRLRLEARALTFVNRFESERLSDVDVCWTCDRRSADGPPTARLTARHGTRAVVMRIRRDGPSAAARIDVPPDLARRFPIGDGMLRRCDPTTRP